MVKVSPAACCIQGLHWELVFETLSAEDVIASMSAIGYEDQTRMPSIRTFHSKHGDRIVIIPKTGRVQLRLDLATEKAERTQRAVAIAKWIVASHEVK